MPRRREAGYALLIVLWTTALLGALAAALLATARSDTQLARNVAQAAQAKALADGGIWLAVQYLASLSDGEGPAGHGAAFAYDVGDAKVWVAVEDEAGKIDLNLAPPALIAGLFRSVGLDPGRAAAIADAIADWRDRDGDRRPGGAEDADYARAGRPYAPRNGPFPRLDELRLVAGIDAALFARAAPALTVHSGRTTIDPWAASRAALLAVPGVRPAEVEALLAARAGVTRRGAPLPQLGGVGAYVGRTTGGETFLVRAEAALPGGARALRESVVELVRGGVPPYLILTWRQSERGVAR